MSPTICRARLFLRTHVVELSADLADSLEVPVNWRPLKAITMGIGVLLSARHS